MKPRRLWAAALSVRVVCSAVRVFHPDPSVPPQQGWIRTESDLTRIGRGMDSEPCTAPSDADLRKFQTREAESESESESEPRLRVRVRSAKGRGSGKSACVRAGEKRTAGKAG